MSTPRVSVVIPTYNRAEFLREAIASVCAQTFADFEIVIGDNASGDHTPQVVADFHDSRIRYFRHATNIGMTPNWQFVISQARGEFVATLADDDLYLPEHLAVALDALAQYPTAAYYACPSEYFGRGATGFGRPLAIADTTTPLIYFAPSQAVNFLGIDNPGPMTSMVCRRETLDGIFWGKPDFLPQDLLVMTQLMTRGGFVFGNRAGTRYRIHMANISRGSEQKAKILRFSCMVWYGVRWLTHFLLERELCTLEDIEVHGKCATSEYHVVPLVLALGSFDSPPAWRAVAWRVFQARRDMDVRSARFRLARRLGFGVIPISEKVSQIQSGWRP